MPRRTSRLAGFLVRASLAIGFSMLLLVAWSAEILDWKRVPGAEKWASLQSLSLDRDHAQPFESTGVPRSALLRVSETVGSAAKVFGTVAHTADVQVQGVHLVSNLVFVQGDYFGAAGVRLFHGSAPFPSIGDAPKREVVISHRVWREYFSSDPNVLGRTLSVASRSMDGRSWVELRVVGVANEGFAGVDSAEREDAWVPWGDWPDILLPSIESPERVGDMHFPLRAGMSVDPASSRAVTEALLQVTAPDSTSLRRSRILATEGFGLDPVTRARLAEQSRLYRSASIGLACVLATGYFLWLRLQHVRASGESAVRAVLGETARRRFRREFAVNFWRVLPSLVIGAASALAILKSATLLDAMAPVGGIVRQFLENFPWVFWSVLVVGSAAALAVLGMDRRTVGFGDFATLTPGRFAHRRHSRAPLHVGFAMLGIICASGLAELHSLVRLLQAPLGFETADRRTILIEPRDPAAPEWYRYASRADARPLETALIDALERDPRVSGVTLSTNAPLGEGRLGSIQITDPRDGHEIKSDVLVNEVGAQFNALYGLRVSEGRMPDPDVPTEVAVSETFASMYLPRETEGPLMGRRFLLSTPIQMEAKEVEVVGVVASPHRITAKASPSPVVYRALRHMGAAWTVNFQATDAAVSAAVQGAERVAADFVSSNWRLGPAVAIDAVAQGQLASDRWRVWAIGAMLVTTLALGALAFVSAMRQWLLERATEMAVRRALGASRGHLARSALGIGPAQLLAVTVAMLFLATFVTRWVKPELPAVQAGIAALCAAAIMLAMVGLCVLAAVSSRQEARLMDGLRGS